MQNSDVLKMFTFYFISEQDEIPEKLKIDFLKEIETANEFELISILLYESFLEVKDRQELINEFEDSEIGNFLMAGLLQEGGFQVPPWYKDIQGMSYAGTQAAGKVAVPLLKNAVKLGGGLFLIAGKIFKLIGKVLVPVTKGAAKAILGMDPYKKVKREFLDLSQISYKKRLSESLTSFNEVHKLLPWVAIPAIALTLGYKAYQTLSSKASRACRNSKNPVECKKTFKRKALEIQIDILRSNRSKCSQSSNPMKCVEKIDHLVSKKEVQLSNI